MLLECFIAVIIVFYFGSCKGLAAYKVIIILLFSVIGISGSFAVAAFGMRVNTFANSRTAFASLRGKAFPCYNIPLQAGMSIGMLLDLVELLIMLFILLFIPGDLAGPASSASPSANRWARRPCAWPAASSPRSPTSARPDEDRLQDQGRRRAQPRRDRRLHRRQRGRFGGPSADGFETYGVTGVALITFILLAVTDPTWCRCSCWSGSSSCA
jgi:K(+)-stimulated pyrophosphate-energized sodium pump